MTDEQIVKALECCSQDGVCENCPANGICDNDGFIGAILALIKRQQAEIEEQDKAILNALKRMGEVRAEAVREFAERLKKWKYQSSDWSHGEHPFVVEETDIDDLVIEMTEKEEAEKPSSDDDFEARDILQDILEEEELERHIEEMLMDAIEEGADNA